MINPDDAALMRESFKSISHFSSEVANRLYAKLFEKNADIKRLFASVRLREQHRMLAASLHYVVMNYEHAGAVRNSLRRMGARHVGYGARPEHYRLFAECLIESLAETLGSEWTPQLDRIWREAIHTAIGIMLEAYEQEPTRGVADVGPA